MARLHRIALIPAALTGAALLVAAIPATAMPDPFPGLPGDRAPAAEVWGRPTRPGSLDLDAQIFAGYHATFLADDQTANAFVLDRAELGAAWRSPDLVGAELRTEAVRAAGPNRALGVDGDPLVLRVRRAWAYAGVALGPVDLRFDAGLVADPWIGGLEAAYPLRGLAPLLAESGGLFDTSDLGAIANIAAWQDRLQLALAVTNGEGRSQREQNEGKSFTARLGVTAVRTDAGLEVTLHAVYRDGSVGVGEARDDRYGAGLTLTHPDATLGATFAYADGYAGDSDRKALGVEGWADARLLWDALGVAARYERLAFEPGQGAEASRQRVSAGVFGDLDGVAHGLRRLRLYLVYEADTADEGASPFPGVAEAGDAHRVLLQLEARAGRVF